MKSSRRLFGTSRHHSCRFEGYYVYLELAHRLDELTESHLDGRWACGGWYRLHLLGP